MKAIFDKFKTLRASLSLIFLSIATMFVSSTASADYATDIQANLLQGLTELKASGLAMFGDALPFIIAMSSIGVLVGMVTTFIRRMRA